MTMDVQSVMESITALPGTLAALTQSSTDMPLCREIAMSDNGDFRPVFCVGSAWSDGRQQSATRDKTTQGGGVSSTGATVTITGQGVDGGRDALLDVNPAAAGRAVAEALSAAQPISDMHAKIVDRSNRVRPAIHRQALLGVTQR